MIANKWRVIALILFLSTLSAFFAFIWLVINGASPTYFDITQLPKPPDTTSTELYNRFPLILAGDLFLWLTNFLGQLLAWQLLFNLIIPAENDFLRQLFRIVTFLFMLNAFLANLFTSYGYYYPEDLTNRILLIRLNHYTWYTLGVLHGVLMMLLMGGAIYKRYFPSGLSWGLFLLGLLTLILSFIGMNPNTGIGKNGNQHLFPVTAANMILAIHLFLYQPSEHA